MTPNAIRTGTAARLFAILVSSLCALGCGTVSVSEGDPSQSGCTFGQDDTCSDGNNCTIDTCQVDGTCTYEPRTNVCLISGTCYEDGAVNQDEPCQACDVDTSPVAWSPVGPQGCDDGLACTLGDSCQDGACEGGSDGPCFNNGTCVEADADSFTCECPDGFEGETCEVNTDPDCEGIVCENGGICAGGLCECADGFIGDNCEVNTDPCADVVCENGGTCADGLCECVDDWTGDTCEVSPDACDDVTCLNGGTCVAGACECVDGWTGPACETTPDPCADVTCLNGGNCADGLCTCTDGWTGETCDEDIDDCTDDACENGGVCTDTGTLSYECDCTDTGFEGETCGDPVDDCTEDACQNGGTCVDGVMGFTCECTPGWLGETCEVDFCAAVCPQVGEAAQSCGLLDDGDAWNEAECIAQCGEQAVSSCGGLFEDMATCIVESDQGFVCVDDDVVPVGCEAEDEAFGACQKELDYMALCPDLILAHSFCSDEPWTEDTCQAEYDAGINSACPGEFHELVSCMKSDESMLQCEEGEIVPTGCDEQLWAYDDCIAMNIYLDYCPTLIAAAQVCTGQTWTEDDCMADYEKQKASHCFLDFKNFIGCMESVDGGLTCSEDGKDFLPDSCPDEFEAMTSCYDVTACEKNCPQMVEALDECDTPMPLEVCEAWCSFEESSNCGSEFNDIMTCVANGQGEMACVDDQFEILGCEEAGAQFQACKDVQTPCMANCPKLVEVGQWCDDEVLWTDEYCLQWCELQENSQCAQEFEEVMWCVGSDAGYVDCIDGHVMPMGCDSEMQQLDACSCEPQCDDGVTCGDDGCGGTCGCTAGTSCIPDEWLCVGGSCEVTVTITIDQYGPEMGYEILDHRGLTVAVAGDFPNEPGFIVSETYTLDRGAYTLRMTDTYGDGWNGGTVTIDYTTPSEGEEPTILWTTTLHEGSEGFTGFVVNCDGCEGYCSDGPMSCGNDGCGASCGDCPEGLWCGPSGMCEDSEPMTLCDIYCDLVVESCTGTNAIDFVGTSCHDACSQWPEGVEGDTMGNTTHCRIHHLYMATNPDMGGPNTYCSAAGPDGGDICVDWVIEPQCQEDWDCDDGDPCTVDHCDPVTSQCTQMVTSCWNGGTCQLDGDGCDCPPLWTGPSCGIANICALEGMGMREVVEVMGNDLILDEVFVQPTAGDYLVAFTPNATTYYIGGVDYSANPSCNTQGGCIAVDALKIYNVTPAGTQGDNLDPVQLQVLNGKHVAVYSEYPMANSATLDKTGPGRMRIIAGLSVDPGGEVAVELDRPYQNPQEGNYVVTAHYEGDQFIASGEAYYINTTSFSEAGPDCMWNGQCPSEINQLGIYQATANGTKGEYQSTAGFEDAHIYVLDNWGSTMNCMDMCVPNTSFPAGDGCNTCTCPESGKKNQASCSAMACQPGNPPGQ